MLKFSALQQHVLFELCAPEIYEIFVYKHTETIEYAKNSLPFKKIQTSRINNSRILRIKNAKRLGYCFYINRNI